MKKIIGFSILLLFASIACFAQADSISVSVRNQYEGETSNATVTVLKTGQLAITDERGLVTLKALHIAIGMETAQMIFPFIKNKIIEPALVAKFTILAFALACIKS